MDEKRKAGLIVLVVGIAIVILGVGLRSVVNNAVRRSVERRMESEMEKQTGEDADISLDQKRESFSIETGEGRFEATATGELPADFPNDLETYPGADITGSYSMEAEEGTGASITLTTQDPIQTVSEFYVNSLENNGWVISGKLEAEDTFTVVASKDTRSAVVGVGRGEEGTIISISYSTEQGTQE